MDRTSVKVLKYINKQNRAVLAEQVTEKFGDKGSQSLAMLYHEGYLSRSLEQTVIHSNTDTEELESKTVLTNVYYIEPLGRDFLEHRFGNTFDRWLGRANGISSILGGALLSKPLWAILEWSWAKALLIWDWLCGLF